MTANAKRNLVSASFGNVFFAAFCASVFSLEQFVFHFFHDVFYSRFLWCA